MNWFRKSSQNDSGSPPQTKIPKMRRPKWFTRGSSNSDATAEGVVPQEIDVVPRTEISASRQALDNITLVLNAANNGEASGESSLTRKCRESISCENKYCCGVAKSHSHATSADNETAVRSSKKASREQRKRLSINDDVKHACTVDYVRLEVPDSAYPSVFDWSSINYDEAHRKNISTINYQATSDIEYKLEQSDYDIKKCKFFNHEYRKEYESLGSGCRPQWKLEDFNDDRKSTPMADDTRTIKEFYRLSELNDILLHYHDIIIVQASCSVECVKDGFFGFLSWLIFKGKEIKEKHKVSEGKCLWLRKLLKLFKHPRNKAEHNDPGEGVEAYTLSLAQDDTSVFAKNIHNFIACTRESKEKIPQKVMRNMRQFMNGMKNYLVKHGEKDFGIEVEKARAALKSDEFLNLDQILEGVMHQLVIMPLREHLYELFVDYYGSQGDIELIVNNMKYGENKDATTFGVKKGLRTPPPQILNHISMVFAKLQEAELPFEKLNCLLNAVTMILDNTVDADSESSDVRHLGCDDFLPLLAYVICKCGFHFAEVEAEYMWGLLQPTLMIGQAGYYVTSLCSAAISLKEFKSRLSQENGEDGDVVPNIPLECSVLRIIIPDEYNGSIQTKTIPVRPHTTTKEVCRIIAHKSQITNPMDYGLFKLVDGEETLLMDNDCPQEIRLASAGKHCMLAYKRFDAKIAWPKQ